MKIIQRAVFMQIDDSYILKISNERWAICKNDVMARQGSHHGAFHYFQYFFTRVPLLFSLFSFVNSYDILKFCPSNIYCLTCLRN